MSLFESGLIDFDNNIAFVNLSTLEEFFNLDKDDRSLEIYLKNPQKIEDQKSKNYDVVLLLLHTF